MWLYAHETHRFSLSNPPKNESEVSFRFGVDSGRENTKKAATTARPQLGDAAVLRWRVMAARMGHVNQSGLRSQRGDIEIHGGGTRSDVHQEI
jgi:hypothetical protein